MNHEAPQSKLRAAIYTRFSSSMQRPASSEDQRRNCERFIQENGWVLVEGYVRSDEAKTGKTLRHRHALESLLIEAEQKQPPFDVLVVDEQSRLGRNLSDILNIEDRLRHYGIKLAIVARRLVSGDDNFRPLLTMYGMVDEQNSDYLRHRVLRGQEGRVRKGYSSGSRCFGYRSVKDADPSKSEVTSRADILGTRWEVFEPEAETIRRIFQLYADGMSDYQIALKLNGEKVPAARKPRIGKQQTAWNPSLVKNILKREKYIGKIIWNRTTQKLNPMTGAIETRKNPPESWLIVDWPPIRIVSDELWHRVQDRLKVVNEKMTRRRIAGCNRAKAKPRLFSGLLFCGECGNSITIGGGYRGVAKTYGCVSSRYKRGCTNNLWIREDRLDAQLISGLVNNILAPEAMEYFVEAVSVELDAYLKGNSTGQMKSIDSLRSREDELNSSIARLVDAILMNSTSNALSSRLKTLESELEQVRADIALNSRPEDLKASKLDLHAIVRGNVEHLLDLLNTDVIKARQVLQRHITKLHLFPGMSESGPVYEVIGEIDLFAPAHRKECILLVRSGTGIVQQYANVIDFSYCFAGPTLVTQTDPWINPLIEPVGRLLHERPELLHTPMVAKEWLEPITSMMPESDQLRSRVTGNYISWQFRNRKSDFEKAYGMTEIVIGRDKYYMFAKVERVVSVEDAA